MYTTLYGLAIPNYDRPVERIADAVLSDLRLDDLVVVDDGSPHPYSIDHGVGNYPRLVMHPDNVGCYRNKRRAVQACANAWVILLDSDNAISEGYLDALDRYAPHDTRVLYCPTFARPAFDYREYTGLIVDKHNVAAYVDRPRFLTALNTGNFLVHRETYLKVHNDKFDPLAADSLYFCVRWLERGGLITFVPNLEYEHALSADSNYVKHAEASAPIFADLTTRLRGMR